jgi:hypothetical protein
MRFRDFLILRLPLGAALREVSELFPREQMNDLFKKEVDRLLATQQDSEARNSLLAFRGMDHIAYIDRSLRRAGFRDHDLDELVSQIVTKLILGSFFSGWRGQPLEARFKTAIRNAISTLAVRRQKAARRSQELPPDPVARTSHQHEVIEEFRNFLKSWAGETAVQVLDQRLAGEDVKELVGTLGIETGYRLKLIVQKIKEGARKFAKGDPDFLSMVERAFDREQKTVQKRFGGNVLQY